MTPRRNPPSSVTQPSSLPPSLHPPSMPKKHHKPTFSKPTGTAHHTLTSSSSRNNPSDRFRPSQSSSSAEQPSVNDLISHLRRTQVSRPDPEDGRPTPSLSVARPSVHPSLRNLLELPETPPPRPRPGTRRIGVGRRNVRRTPGPPPPESWLLGNSTAGTLEEDGLNDPDAAHTKRIIYRLDRLPGKTMPQANSLVHMVLKSMAMHWVWHLEYDGQFLALLPSHIRVLLLSYIGIYARDQPVGGLMHGLRPLFEKHSPDGQDSDDGDDMGDSEVSRLDLSSAIGRWMSLKQLSSELFVSQSTTALKRDSKEPVPSSWDQESDEEADSANASHNVSIPKAPSQHLRFENLRFLSLAHPNRAAANWNSLIRVLSRLSTLTHLSLAHWPVPTATPNAVDARIRHPSHRSLTFSYSGTDSYSAMENNWAEAASILRRFSRVTYCLKWLDLEGCGDWIPALNWDGAGPDGEAFYAGPEWNTSWRDIEFIRLGPGWLPHIDDGELLPSTAQTDSGELSSPSRSLATSMHAPAMDSEASDLPWDVEVERIKYRRSKELELYRETVQSAKVVQQRVQRLRKEGRGKWAQFSFGLEGLYDGVLRKLLGPEYFRVLP